MSAVGTAAERDLRRLARLAQTTRLPPRDQTPDVVRVDLSESSGGITTQDAANDRQTGCEFSNFKKPSMVVGRAR